MMRTVVDIVDEAQLNKLIASQALVVVHFWADWAKPCVALNKVLEELARKHPACWFGRVEAERWPQLSEQHKIAVVPTFLLWKGGAATCAVRIEGAKTAELTQAVARLAATAAADQQPGAGAGAGAPVASAPGGGGGEELKARLVRLVNHASIMLFMKGTPSAPQCGFSRQAVEVRGGFFIGFHF